MIPGPRALMDAHKQLFEDFFDKGILRGDLRDLCKDVARELSRETFFRKCLIKIFGAFHQQLFLDPSERGKGYKDPSPGGWIAARDGRPEWRRQLLGADREFAWNLFHFVAAMSPHKCIEVDLAILPRRTEFLFTEYSYLYEEISTMNRRLYDQLWSNMKGAGQNGRAQLLVSMVDAYYFEFAYWAVVQRDESSLTFPDQIRYWLPGAVRRVWHAHERKISEGKLTPSEITSRHVYFQILQSYLKMHFRRLPTEVMESIRAYSEAQRLLHMPVDTERFLRILIDMWMERNSVLNPDRQEHASSIESSDAENQLKGAPLECPTTMMLHSTILVVSHLLMRKAEIDLVMNASHRQAPIQNDEALIALHQPSFVLLVVLFRNVKAVAQSTEFFLAVELWLAYLDPGRLLNNRDKAKTWRRVNLKHHVTAHLHFYTTLFTLFLRKVREALMTDQARQEVLMALLKRVLGVFKDKDLVDAITAVSGLATELYRASGRMRGYEVQVLKDHLYSCRLRQSSPCLWENAKVDARHLHDELCALEQQAAAAAAQSRKWYNHPLIRSWAEYLHMQYERLMGEQEVHQEPALTPEFEPADFKKQIEGVRAEMVGVFGSDLQRHVSAKPEELSLPPEREGPLLTKTGRVEVLSGVRTCEDMKVDFLGDPLFRPDIGEYEIEWLVKATQWMSVLLSQWLFSWHGPPQHAPAHEEGHLDVTARLSPYKNRAPVNLRLLADRRWYVLLTVCGLVLWFVWKVVSFMSLLLQRASDELGVS